LVVRRPVDRERKYKDSGVGVEADVVVVGVVVGVAGDGVVVVVVVVGAAAVVVGDAAVATAVAVVVGGVVGGRYSRVLDVGESSVVEDPAAGDGVDAV
jgi:hypothetical protein